MIDENKVTKKAYITTSTGGACGLRYDYSFAINCKCLECVFCYKHLVNRPARKKYVGSLAYIERRYNKHLFSIPITVSRYCDPLYSKDSIHNSYIFCEYVLANGGSVIFKTAIPNIPDKFLQLFEKYSDKVQLQIRLFATNTVYGNIIMSEYCNNFSTFDKFIDVIDNTSCDKAIVIDPLIIGINDNQVLQIVKHALDYDIKKIIIKQLFSTPYFKTKLSFVSKRYAALLLQNVSCNYSTYDNLDIIDSLSTVIEYCNVHDIKLSFCQNATLNKLLGIGHNCCLNDNVKYVIYSNNFYDRRNGTKIIPLE